MRVLAFETSTSRAGIALVDHQGIVAESLLLAPMRHLEWILVGLESMLREAGVPRDSIEGVAVSLGPGSFTGLRIGIATAIGLAKGWEVPIVGVPTLDVVAAGIPRDGLVCALLDARRGEVAAAIFRIWRGALTRITGDLVAPIREAIELLEGYEGEIALTGEGVARFGKEILDNLGNRIWIAPPVYWPPRAAMVGWLGRALLLQGVRGDPYHLQPVYVRRPVPLAPS
ncbi:MAG: tRNA (adenosine(37)-N6)-threonylcarbamoyltransferase complex dimerization subunit type 1 TsaB [Armatimonadota bacterium]|nr:tRNA (adenosine(37)-N6)-threonylcarbamoyltransferase complex dimerization subunit type 1 TsaB [Armatimonadota bacterium]MDR5702162.1 tRNA (adenosine(37)-N6)-threonylcarbamoyltransferase complex dimerization subunit type 1 TsaB [Armatimonadota bacterium]